MNFDTSLGEMEKTRKIKNLRVFSKVRQQARSGPFLPPLTYRRLTLGGHPLVLAV